MSGLTAAACLAVQLTAPPAVDAAPLSSASAGSTLPPTVSAIQSFQPDLFSGRATTSVPLAVPPGRAGLQPSVALAYSSTSSYGWLGVGWMLELGHIERTNKNGPIAYDNEFDTFVFSMAGVSSELVGSGVDYRAKDERFQKFRIPAGWWEVRDQSGARYMFGDTPESRIADPADPGKIYRWALRVVEDANGNRMEIRYARDGNQLYPEYIDYGVKTTVWTHQVRFYTEPHPHPVESYRSGFSIRTARRLWQIDASVMSGTTLQLARRYKLGYTTSGRTPRSLLTSITQVGADGTSTLPATTLAYNSTPESDYSVQYPSNVIPQIAADVSGDGITDVVLFQGGVWKVAKGRATKGFDAPTVWTSPSWNASAIPTLGDWNGDGIVDVGAHLNGRWQFARSTGSAFIGMEEFQWSGGAPMSGDFNGDGYTDLAMYNNGQWLVATNNAYRDPTLLGFAAQSGFTTTFGSGNIPLTGDFNGDGFTDVARLDPAAGVWVGLSKGRSFVSSQWLSGPIGASDSRFMTGDMNADGKTDVVYVRYAPDDGWVYYAPSRGTQFQPAPFTKFVKQMACRAPSCSLQLADFDGDGSTDPASFDPTTPFLEIWYAQGTFADLLARINNGRGGTTRLAYYPSTRCDTCATTPMTLPFVMPLLRSATMDDNRGHTTTTTYDYALGRYESREFRGFGRVTAKDPIGTVAKTEFHQDEHLKGRPKLAEVRDAAGNLWTRTINTWSDTDVAAGVHFVTLDKAESQDHGGDASFVSTVTRYAYDTTHGQVTKIFQDGDPGVASDDRRVEREYAVNSNNTWIVRLKRTKTFDAATAGAVIAQRQRYYDGATTVDVVAPKGNLTQEAAWLNTTDTWLGMKMTYDAAGNILTLTDAEGRTTTNTYDANGNFLTQVKNHLGHIRVMVSDARFGQVTKITDENNLVSSSTYDTFGRLTAVYGPNSTTVPNVRYIYAPGNPISKVIVCALVQTGGTELCSSTFSDGFGRTLQARAAAEDPTKEVVTGSVEFNNRGLVDRQWIPYLEATSTTYVSPINNASAAPPVTYTYDVAGRATKATTVDGSTLTKYGDRVVEMTDPKGNRTRQRSDAYGRLTKVEEINGTETYATTYTHNNLDQLIQVLDMRGNRTTLNYDSLGRKTSMTDPDLGTWVYTYDKLDNTLTQTDPRGAKVTFTYDGLNRLKAKTFTVPTGSDIPDPADVTYFYDEANAARPYTKGRLTRVAYGTDQTGFEYSNLGQLLKEVKRINGVDYTVQRTYDLLGRALTLTYPDGEVATHTYNRQGGLDRIVIGTQTIVANIDYNAALLPLKLELGNQAITTYGYAAQTSRLKTLTTQRAGATLQQLTYGYDLAGNLTSITDGVTSTASQTFEYDALDRLTKATGAYGTQTYAFDAIGNMTSKEGVTLSYPPAGQSRPHAVLSAVGAGTQIGLTYDANGNVTKRMDGAVTRTLTYNAANRLTKVVDSSSSLVDVSFGFDGDGGRVTKTTPSGTTIYVGSLYEVAPGGKTTKHVYGGSIRVATIEKQGTARMTYFVHGDHLGSSSLVTDASGQVVSRTHYRPFGGIQSQTGTLTLAHRFTGQRQDDVPDLIIFPGRVYDTKLARFLQADPFVQAATDPQFLNRYSYVRNNPVNNIDPSGYFSFRKYISSWFSKERLSRGQAPGPIVAPTFHQEAQEELGQLVAKTGIDPVYISAAVAAAPHLAMGNFIAAGITFSAAIAAHEVRDTGEGRQLTRRVANEFFDDALGMKPHAAYVAAAISLEAALGVAFESALTIAMKGPPQPARPKEPGATVESPGGYDPFGRYPGDGGSANDPSFRTTMIGPNKVALAQGPIEQGIFKFLPIKAIHTGAAIPGGGGMVRMPGGWYLYGSFGVCHTSSNLTALQGGVSNTVLTNAMDWSTVASTLLYGTYGGHLFTSVGVGVDAYND